MTNDYKYGEEFELDEIRANVNLSKVIKGMDKNLKIAIQKPAKIQQKKY